MIGLRPSSHKSLTNLLWMAENLNNASLIIIIIIIIVIIIIIIIIIIWQV